MIRGNRPRLSRVELALVLYRSEGLTPRQIIAELGITQNNYSQIRKRALDKLGAMNDWQAGVLTERYQLVPVDKRNVIEDRREERLSAQ